MSANIGGPVGSSPLSGLKGLFGNFGKTLQDGFKSVFAPDQVAQGWRDVLHLTPKVPSGAVPAPDPGLLTDSFTSGGIMNAPAGPKGFFSRVSGHGSAGGFMNKGTPVAPSRLPLIGADPVAPVAPVVGPAPAPVVGPTPVGPEPTPTPTPSPAPAGGSTFTKGLAEIGSGMLKAARNSALVSGAISAAINGYKVVTGQEQTSQAVGSVAADTASGAVSGAVGAAASGLAIAAAGAAGLTVGLPLTLIGVAAGLGGAMLGGLVFNKSGLYDGIKNGITKMLGGTTNTRPGTRPYPGTQPYPGTPVRPVTPTPVTPYPGTPIRPNPGNVIPNRPGYQPMPAPGGHAYPNPGQRTGYPQPGAHRNDDNRHGRR